MDWDDTFESLPTDGSQGSTGDDAIRDIKVGKREREELEHNFEAPSTQLHKPGLCSVVFVGTTAEINALSIIKSGGIAYDTELEVLKGFNGTEWIPLARIHADLLNLDADDHPQYLHLDKAGQTISQSFTTKGSIGGVYIGAEGNKLDGLIYKSSGILDLIFQESDNTLIRASGSFIDEGFSVGEVIYTTNTDNPGPFVVSSIVSPSIMEVVGTVVDATDSTVVLFVMKKGFSQLVPAATGVQNGPEITDCIIVVTGGYGVFYSGTTSADTRRAAFSTYNAGFVPVRRGEYWKYDGVGAVYKVILA